MPREVIIIDTNNKYKMPLGKVLMTNADANEYIEAGHAKEVAPKPKPVRKKFISSSKNIKS